MNRESLRQTLRVHVMRLRQQHQRQQHQQDGGAASCSGFVVNCTVDELVHQVEGSLSTDKPDYGFGEALARLQVLMGGAGASSVSHASVPIRRSSIGSAGRRGSISEIIDAEAVISRLKTFA